MTEASVTRALSVADTLRARIFDGQTEPGTHLMEVTLAEELGVSRTPVRDALSRLADEGLLVYQPNRGFIVRRFEIKDVVDAFTVRASLEGLGCRLIGERGLDGAAHKRLESLLAEQQKVLYADDWTSEQALIWQDLNLDFHFALLELADNPWLVEAVKRSRRLPIIYDSRSRPHDLTGLRLMFRRTQSRMALDEHQGIVDCLVRRETTRAENMMREHILTNRDVLVRALHADRSNPELAQRDAEGLLLDR